MPGNLKVLIRAVANELGIAILQAGDTLGDFGEKLGLVVNANQPIALDRAEDVGGNRGLRVGAEQGVRLLAHADGQLAGVATVDPHASINRRGNSRRAGDCASCACSRAGRHQRGGGGRASRSGASRASGAGRAGGVSHAVGAGNYLAGRASSSGGARCWGGRATTGCQYEASNNQHHQGANYF